MCGLLSSTGFKDPFPAGAECAAIVALTPLSPDAVRFPRVNEKKSTGTCRFFAKVPNSSR
jgi:hypothetical protein